MTGVRKVSHNEMERRRRKELRVEFQRLRQHVPSVAHDKVRICESFKYLFVL